MERRGRIVRGVWAACLLLAGLNHARILIRHGLSWDYHGMGWASSAYWSSLTIVDPLVAVLLFARPRIGVPATAVVIATNVVHNLAMWAHYLPEGAFLRSVASSPQLMSQLGFLIFVGATYRMAWRGLHKDRLPPAASSG